MPERAEPTANIEEFGRVALVLVVAGGWTGCRVAILKRIRCC